MSDFHLVHLLLIFNAVLIDLVLSKLAQAVYLILFSAYINTK